MRTVNEYEECFVKNTKLKTITLLMEFGMLKREQICVSCSKQMKFVKYKRNVDEYAFRCLTSQCKKYSKYISIRKGSFFGCFNISLELVMRIVLKFVCKVQLCNIIKMFDVNRKVIEKVITKLVSLIPISDFADNKLGGPNMNVQIDETMLNFKCKSHRGRAATNKSDALCIVEVGNTITRAFACIIENKTENVLLPIITRQVAYQSIIWTDEHKAYCNLSKHGYIHRTVCHKYQFVTQEGINTQSVESFNNELKLEIKRRKGIRTSLRGIFLKEFCFKFNNRSNLLAAVFNLIKL